ADRRIGESWNQVSQPARIDHVIGIDDGDYVSVRGRVGESQPQRACLESLQHVGAHELEPFAKTGAMLFYGLPHRRIGRVVDDQNALEVRAFEAGACVESGLTDM